MRKENTLLGAFHIAISILYIVISVAIAAIVYGKSLLSTGLFDFNPVNVAGAVAAAFLFVFAIVGFISGTAMMLNQRWAQIPVLILGCINLISIPLGTTLGVYTIWVYMHDDKRQKTAELVNRPVKVALNEHEEIGYHFSLLRKGVN
jgi:fructose-specific phosphotransferase system IIC component